MNILQNSLIGKKIVIQCWINLTQRQIILCDTTLLNTQQSHIPCNFKHHLEIFWCRNISILLLLMPDLGHFPNSLNFFFRSPHHRGRKGTRRLQMETSPCLEMSKSQRRSKKENELCLGNAAWYVSCLEMDKVLKETSQRSDVSVLVPIITLVC